MHRFLFLLFSLLMLAAFAPSGAYACGRGCMKKEKQENADQKCCCAKKDATNGHCGSGTHSCDGHCGGNCTCPVVHAGAFFVIEEITFFLSDLATQQAPFAYQAPFTSGIRSGVWLPPNFRA